MDSPWTPELIARLRTLWAEGHTTAEIGRRLGVSKNGIVGKAHRLGLDARKSPIKSTKKRAAFVPPPASIPRVHAPADRSFSAEEDAVILRFPDAAPRWIACILVDRNPPQIWQRRYRLQRDRRRATVMRGGFEQPRPVMKAPKPEPVRTTLPPLASVHPAPRALPPILRPAPVTTDGPASIAYQPKRRRDGSGCSYPIGEPGTRGFRFCDADLSGQSYCREHHRLCHGRAAA